MTSNRKSKKEERQARQEYNRQCHVGFNREVYNELCGLLSLVASEGDRDIMDLPEPIAQDMRNAELSVEDTRGAVRYAINTLRVALNAESHCYESASREKRSLANQISDMRKGDNYDGKSD